MIRPRLRALSIGAAVVVGGLLPAADAAARACLIGEGARVLRRGPAIERCEDRLALSVSRGEYAAFQVVVEPDGPAELEGATVAVDPGPYRFRSFVEHFVDVPRRSRTNDTKVSLGFTEAARPRDEGMLGAVPDALLPVERAPSWAPYPLRARAGERAILFVEAYVPEDGQPGTTSHVVRVEGPGITPQILTVDIDAQPTVLPYRAVSSFVFYDAHTLEKRFERPEVVERDLVATLHHHGLETITTVLAPADLERLSGMISGAWFGGAPADGPGRGVGASLLALGAYGALGAPAPSKVASIDAMASRLPPSVEDVFVYAIDEVCESPVGGGWRALLDEAEVQRVGVGVTCSRDPAAERADIVMAPAQDFDPELAEHARALGKRVWTYNGMLPHAGTMELDVPPTSLTANGWIAALFDVGRWFYWESIFWNDGNRGGHGENDPFASAETFHNADGDTSLYDGLLLFPGRMPPRFSEHDLGADVVLPSLRLKALRRGIEDAGLIALAAQVDPVRTHAIVRRVVPAALDEVDRSSASRLALGADAQAEARAELRALIAGASVPPSSQPSAVRAALRSLRDRAAAERRATGAGQSNGPRASASPFVLALIVAFGIGFGITAMASRRSRKSPKP